tara:strand:+ start:1016 stop:1339 length:324 start_codon:yes stop_codon:yes gene_type:complete
MPRPPKGQLSLGEIRNMARQHNKVSAIKNIDGLSRKALLAEIEGMGYQVDHVKKMIYKVRARKGGEKVIKVSKSGEVVPNKTTKKKVARKKLISGGSAVPLYGGDEV